MQIFGRQWGPGWVLLAGFVIFGLIGGGVWSILQLLTVEQPTVVVVTPKPEPQPEMVVLMAVINYGDTLVSPVIEEGDAYYLYVVADRETADLHLLLAVDSNIENGSVRVYLVKLVLNGASYGVYDEQPYLGRAIVYNSEGDCYIELSHTGHPSAVAGCVP